MYKNETKHLKWVKVGMETLFFKAFETNRSTPKEVDNDLQKRVITEVAKREETSGDIFFKDAVVQFAFV
jgi:hypothetical protein